MGKKTIKVLDYDIGLSFWEMFRIVRLKAASLEQNPEKTRKLLDEAKYE